MPSVTCRPRGATPPPWHCHQGLDSPDHPWEMWGSQQNTPSSCAAPAWTRVCVHAALCPSETPEGQPGGAFGQFGIERSLGYRDRGGCLGLYLPCSTPQRCHRNNVGLSLRPAPIRRASPGPGALQASRDSSFTGVGPAYGPWQTLMGKNGLSGGSGWNFRHSGLALPSWPTSPCREPELRRAPPTVPSPTTR